MQRLGPYSTQKGNPLQRERWKMGHMPIETCGGPRECGTASAMLTTAAEYQWQQQQQQHQVVTEKFIIKITRCCAFDVGCVRAEQNRIENDKSKEHGEDFCFINYKLSKRDEFIISCLASLLCWMSQFFYYCAECKSLCEKQ